MASQSRKSTVLLCSVLIIFEKSWLAACHFSCYSGNVDIVNGVLSVASTKFISAEICQVSPLTPPVISTPRTTPTTSPKNHSHPEITSDSMKPPEGPPPESTSQMTAGSTEGLGPSSSPERSPGPVPNETSSSANAETAGPNLGTPGPTPFGAHAETPGVTPAGTPGTMPGGSPRTSQEASPQGSPAETLETTPDASPGATSAIPLASLIGCVVTTLYNHSRDSMVASFSCPTPDLPCQGIGFNGTTGPKNQTQCCMGPLCNTVSSLIIGRNNNYSTVESCFVGNGRDASETPCGDSSNMCLTLSDPLREDNMTVFYCGNQTLQSFCEHEGALREGSYKQEGSNMTVHCCASTNCNSPFSPSTGPPPSTISTSSTGPPLLSSSVPSPPHIDTPLPTGTPPTGTPGPTVTPLTGSPSPTLTGTPHINATVHTNGHTSTALSTGTPQTNTVPSSTTGHSNKTLIIGIVAAFVVGLVGGVIITIIICRRRKNSDARPGELLSFDSFHYKRMGADEISDVDL